MGRYVIGVDNGGTFIKAALYDEHGRMVSLAREASRTIIPEPGRVEINLNELWAINSGALPRCWQKAGFQPGKWNVWVLQDRGKAYMQWIPMVLHSGMELHPQITEAGNLQNSGWRTGPGIRYAQ